MPTAWDEGKPGRPEGRPGRTAEEASLETRPQNDYEMLFAVQSA